jgi:glycosyltransferase involved in cell wall biosynthesis
MGVHKAPNENELQRLDKTPYPTLLQDDHASGLAEAPDPVSLIVHSHLRWDFVWQRPQQVLSRLATHHRVLFLEEAIDGQDTPRLEVSEPAANVIRAVPIVRGCGALSPESLCEIVRGLLTGALREHPLLAGRFDAAVQWFYSPMNAPYFINRIPCIGVVYDCMDELANFRYAHAGLAEREKFLLKHADVVFTGGYRLYESKSKHNPNTHFYGCGVDVQHFGKARLASTVSPAELSNLPLPVLGYFGVIDERLDYGLLAHLASTFAHASVVMVGPFAKIDPATLPRLANIHWLGQREYRDLPALVKAFDVCLMPFALNEATQFINPTKTLEYMAAGKPIVSTAVPDVIRNFTPIVRVAHSEHEFVHAVNEALCRPDKGLIEEGLAKAGEASWEAIVAAMRKHMLNAVEPRLQASAYVSPRPRPARPAAPRTTSRLPITAAIASSRAHAQGSAGRTSSNER